MATKKSKPGPSAAPPPPGPESYHVQLVVTDPKGAQKQLAGDLVLTDLSVEMPVITTPPLAQSIRAGEEVALSVVATGTEPLTYAWYADQLLLEGETQPTLVDVPDVNTVYAVQVSNAAGMVSAQATVTVLPAIAAPVIAMQPQSSSIAFGQKAMLSVQAVGSPPLTYQWYRGAQVAISGATSPDVEVGPTQTTTYFCRVKNEGGEVDSQSATVTVQPNVVPTVELGLKFRRTIGLPSLWNAFAYGDLAGRIVDGQLRLIFTGDVTQDSPIYEVEVREGEPVATLVQQWWHPYQGKRGTWVQASAMQATIEALRTDATKYQRTDLLRRARWWERRLQPMKGRAAGEWTFVEFNTTAVNGTHYFHPERQLLYIGYGDTYNVTGRQDWTTLAINLRDDGTTEVFGPYRFQVTDKNGYVRIGPHCGGSLRESPFDGSVMSSNSIGSGNAGYPWGANCISGAPWPDAGQPVGPGTPDQVHTDRWLYGYPMFSKIDPQTGRASGPIESARRHRDPVVFEKWPGATMCTFVDPAQYGGVGSWTEIDGLAGLFPLEDRLYFFGSVAGSPIQDPNNCLAAHVWYATASNNWFCTHGCAAVPQYITGPVATAKFPWCAKYPWERLGAVKNTDQDYTPDADVESNLETDFGIVTAPVDDVGHAKAIYAGYFNPDTRRYYTIAPAADRGTITWGVINAFIHEWDVL